MVATTNPPDTLPRFDRTERVIHWTNATLFFVLLFTGASLYVGPLATIVAHRTLMKDIHVYAGLLLPVPVIIGLLFPFGRRFRRDIVRFNRWSADDQLWWSRRTRDRAQLGKFNPGQKLNAVFTAAAIVVMLATGSIMRWFDPFPNSWRTGATFVHDWTFIALSIVITGHIVLATRDRDSLSSMWNGSVPAAWARRERPRWWAEVSGESADAVGDVEAGAEQRLGEARASAGEVPVHDGVDRRASDRVGGREL
jgi:formate dehydrogenase subunit gamma